MSGTTGGVRIADMEARLRSRELVTVRCARCGWERTGLAYRTSSRGLEAGMLEAQRRHVATHAREKAKQPERDRRYRDRRRRFRGLKP